MDIGERFSFDGYDIQARINVLDGTNEGVQQIVVMHNNSSHYLVATTVNGSAGRLILSINYQRATEDELRTLYRLALERAVTVALDY